MKGAAASKKLDSARALLAEGIRSDDALWSAVWSGASEVVELLIVHGADPKKMGQPIEEAIAFCERHRHASIARILEWYR